MLFIYEKVLPYAFQGINKKIKLCYIFALKYPLGVIPNH